MATLVQGPYPTYQLTDEEILSAQALTDLQLFNLQNERTKIVEQKLALVPNPESYSTYIQQEAFLSGQLALIDFLITSHNHVMKEIKS